jgi:hypothetical protein
VWDGGVLRALGSRRCCGERLRGTVSEKGKAVGEFGVDPDGLLAMVDQMSGCDQQLDTDLADVDVAVQRLAG